MYNNNKFLYYCPLAFSSPPHFSYKEYEKRKKIIKVILHKVADYDSFNHQIRIRRLS